MQLKILQRVLAVILCCFIAAVVYMSVLILERQTALQKVSRYNAAWTVSQAVAEFLKLENSLARYATSRDAAAYKEVELRLDIMFSRLEMFEKGAAAGIGAGRSILQLVRNDPGNGRAIALLRTRLDALDALLKLSGGRYDVEEALKLLAPVDAEMTALASRAASFGAELASKDKAQLTHLHLIFTGLAYGLIICGIVLILLMFLQNKLLVRAHRKLEGASLELSSAHEALSLQNQRFDAALNSMSQALCTCDIEGKLVVYNERFSTFFDRTLQQGENVERLFNSTTDEGSASVLAPIYRLQQTFIKEHSKGAFTIDLTDGRSFSIFHEPLDDGGWLATYADVSERRRSDAQIWHVAHHDNLTDLPNRFLFKQELDQEFSKAAEQHANVCILLLDLDGFKEVNDMAGHASGDEVLKQVAARIGRNEREFGCVARFGGDEFAFLLPPQTSQTQACETADKIIRALEAPYALDGREITLSASVGVAVEISSSSSSSDILRHADLALYAAKALGRGRATLFDPLMEIQLQQRKALEIDLRGAVGRGEMEVFYQPLLDVHTREIDGFEALLRWKRGREGFVAPSQFIHLAEETGAIIDLGNHVLRTACAEAATWPSPLTIAVNLSPVQFRDAQIASHILVALNESGLAPYRLELEITESVLLEATESTLATLHQLKQLGVRVALDDFGTGYSSLSYLSSFPFDKIKIDRSFIKDLMPGGHDTAVVELVVDLGRKLNIRTTAEGVETEAQLKRLQDIGCNQVQGFLFAQPRPADQLDFEGSRRVLRKV